MNILFFKFIEIIKNNIVFLGGIRCFSPLLYLWI